MQALNQIFLSVDKILQDEILLEGGIKLYIDPNYNPNFQASVTGKVESIPSNFTNSSLSIGDEIAFSYHIISEQTFKTGDLNFMPITEGNPYDKRWVSAKGDRLTVIAVPKAIGKLWIGILLNRKNERIDGIQGSESEVDRWLSQFSFGTPSNFAFKNLLYFDNKNYWRCDYSSIFAKRVDDKITMLSDRILCEPIDVEVKNRLEMINGIHIPKSSVKLRYYDRAKVVAVNDNAKINVGDVVGFDEQYLEKYELWGKNYFMIKEKRINCLWQETLTIM